MFLTSMHQIKLKIIKNCRKSDELTEPVVRVIFHASKSLLVGVIIDIETNVAIYTLLNHLK